MSLISRASRFARSPQGRALVDKGKKMARDPETRRKLDGMRAKLGKKGAR
jgi:hypothetical protein